MSTNEALHLSAQCLLEHVASATHMLPPSQLPLLSLGRVLDNLGMSWICDGRCNVLHATLVLVPRDNGGGPTSLLEIQIPPFQLKAFVPIVLLLKVSAFYIYSLQGNIFQCHPVIRLN